MKAFVPHKDTLFFLAGIQKKIISHNGKEMLIFPQYPLYSFFDVGIPTDIISCSIELPKAVNDSAVFPILIEGKEKTVELLIPFAKTADKTQMPELILTEEIKNAFPKRERIFKIADAFLEENTWQIFDEKWIKIPKNII